MLTMEDFIKTRKDKSAVRALERLEIFHFKKGRKKLGSYLKNPFFVDGFAGFQGPQILSEAFPVQKIDELAFLQRVLLKDHLAYVHGRLESLFPLFEEESRFVSLLEWKDGKFL